MSTDRPDLPAFDGRDVREHAEAAADAVRAINHITGWPDGLAYPSDAYAVLGQLATVAARLPQACHQIAAQLAGWHAAGHIGIDPGTRYADNPTGALDAATRALGDAAATAGRLYGALHDAAQALAFAHWTGPDQHDHDHDQTTRTTRTTTTGRRPTTDEHRPGRRHRDHRRRVHRPPARRAPCEARNRQDPAQAGRAQAPLADHLPGLLRRTTGPAKPSPGTTPTRPRATSPISTSSTPSSPSSPPCSARWSSPTARSAMPDTPAAPVEHAKAAREALAALDDLDPAQLARRPEDVYALLDHLSMVVSPLWRISAELGRLLDQWADQRGLPRPTGSRCARCTSPRTACRPRHRHTRCGSTARSTPLNTPSTPRPTGRTTGSKRAVRSEQQTPPAAQSLHRQGPLPRARTRHGRRRTHHSRPVPAQRLPLPALHRLAHRPPHPRATPRRPHRHPRTQTHHMTALAHATATSDREDQPA